MIENYQFACQPMFPTILSAVTQSLQLVDVALETRNAVVRETKAAAISLTAIGAGAAMLVGGATLGVAAGVGAVKATCFIEADIGVSIGAGLCLVTVAAFRLKQASARLNEIKDRLTARAAREAAVRIASTGVDMAVSGVASAQEFARSAVEQASSLASRVFQRGEKAPNEESGPAAAKEKA